MAPTWPCTAKRGLRPFNRTNYKSKPGSSPGAGLFLFLSSLGCRPLNRANHKLKPGSFPGAVLFLSLFSLGRRPFSRFQHHTSPFTCARHKGCVCWLFQRACAPFPLIRRTLSCASAHPLFPLCHSEQREESLGFLLALSAPRCTDQALLTANATDSSLGLSASL